MHVPEYFWYDPFDPADWAGFQLKKRHLPADRPKRQRADRAESQVFQIAWALLQTGMDAAQVNQIIGLSINSLTNLH
jgi:hypothetical protein